MAVAPTLPSAELADLANVIAAFSSVDSPKAEEMVAKLEPLAAPDRPFRLSVRELQALVAARKGDLKRARELWTEITKDPRCRRAPQQRWRRCSPSTAPRRRSRVMAKALRAIDSRVLLVALLLSVSLSGCDCRHLRQEEAAAAGRAHRRSSPTASDIEPDKDMANVQIVLPAPVVNDSWPQSGGFANYAMHNLAVGDSPQIIWTADVGAGSSSSRILTTPPVVADGKVFAKDAQSTVSAFNADTGQMIWRVTLKPEKARDADEFGGGLAYYGGRLFVTTGFAAVFSLDPNDGKEIWNSSVSAPVRGAPLVFGDRVFAISIDNKLHALAAVDGSDLWQFSGLRKSPAMSAATARPARATSSWRPSPRASWSACASTTAARCGTKRMIGPRREVRAFGNLSRHSRPAGDRSRRGAGDGLGRPAGRHRAARGQRLWERGIGGNQTPWVAGRFVFVITGSADVAAVEPRQRQGEVGDAAHPVSGREAPQADAVVGPGAGRRPPAGRRLDWAICWRSRPTPARSSARSTCAIRCGWAPVIANRTIYVLTDSGRLIALR